MLVNSFPRTANIFLMTCIEKYLDVPVFSKIPEKLHDINMLSKKDIDQIVIFRNPKETIISFFILMSFLDNQKPTMDVCINEFKKWNDEFAKNIDHIYPLTFEQVTKNTIWVLDCISSTLGIQKQDESQILDLQNTLKTKDGGWNSLKNIQQSSKNDPEYIDIAKDYDELNPSVIAELHEIDLNMRKLIEKRQKDLGWSLVN